MRRKWTSRFNLVANDSKCQCMCMATSVCWQTLQHLLAWFKRNWNRLYTDSSFSWPSCRWTASLCLHVESPAIYFWLHWAIYLSASSLDFSSSSSLFCLPVFPQAAAVSSLPESMLKKLAMECFSVKSHTRQQNLWCWLQNLWGLSQILLAWLHKKIMGSV